MPVFWNQSRATALAVTLLLHAGVAIWLLSVRVDRVAIAPAAAEMFWLPVPPPPPEPPVEPVTSAPAAPVPMPLVSAPPGEPESNAITLPDWEAEARAVARDFGQEPERRRFGPEPETEPRQLKSQRPPPSVFERPLPRVGTTVWTPEGEKILWVSDNCYTSLDSQSLTMREHHALKRGITSCQVGVGKRKARSDLFDPIKRPPRPDPLGKPQQEPGCGPGTQDPSCPP